MINIVIHRTRNDILDDLYGTINNVLWNNPMHKVYSNSNYEKNIFIKECAVMLRFRNGDINKQRGIRPVYYNTDDSEINRYFASTGAKEINLREIMQIVNGRINIYSIKDFIIKHPNLEIRFNAHTMYDSLIVEVYDVSKGYKAFRHAISSYDLYYSDVSFDVLVLAPIIEWLDVEGEDKKEREELRNEHR